ncbi:MAG: hypothetical protein JO163_23025 [Methylobacteriaceae bacterium]|nr:hypothetical protein [Methylobacteriaceae bacterium]MBV9705610.1 hypothetical protein [Methylobacteriaceae bacterium]
MTERKDQTSAISLRRPQAVAYEVGYAKPPQATRFRPGQSGNPHGRPRGSKNKLPALNDERLKTIVLQEAYRTIAVTDRGRTVSISMAQAIIRSMALAAAKGHQRSQRLFTQLLSTTEAANFALHQKFLGTAIDYKNWWDEELRRRRLLGIAGPDPIPHPDDIIIDANTGNVNINGPMTKEEKAASDNPSGRRKKEAYRQVFADIKLLAKEASPEAMQTLISIHEDLKASRATRVAAAERIISRGSGKPLQQIEQGKPGEFDGMSQDELRSYIENQAAELGIRRVN